jgi:hypothetical protein
MFGSISVAVGAMLAKLESPVGQVDSDTQPAGDDGAGRVFNPKKELFQNAAYSPLPPRGAVLPQAVV